MRIRTFALAVAVVVAFSAPSFAQNPIGVWKLNAAKSKFSPGPAPKSSTITITSVAGGSFRSINETVPATGAATKSDVTFKFDGKDNKMTGNPNADTQAYTRVDDRHYTVTTKKGGKVMQTSKIELAADGKSRTNTQTGTDAQGKAINNSIFYDKQ